MNAHVKTSRINFSPNESFSQVGFWIEQHAIESGMDPFHAAKLAHGIEEMIALNPSQRMEIDLICRSLSSEWIEFTLRERGRAFNPILKGYRGLHLDEVHYQRHHPYNVLIFKKIITVSCR